LEFFESIKREELDGTRETDTELSVRIGKGENYIGGIRKQDHIRVTTFDEILTHIGVWNLWYQEPYQTYYWGGEVPPDRSKPVKCAYILCERWFSVGQMHKFYCSDKCRNLANRELEKGRKRTYKPRPRKPGLVQCKWCETMFLRKLTAVGGTPSKYCSDECRTLAKRKQDREAYERNKNRASEQTYPH